VNNVIKLYKLLIMNLAGWMGVVLLLPSVALSQSYFLQSPVQIVSVDADTAIDSAENRMTEWVVIPENNRSGETALNYYSSGNDQRICRVIISATSPQIIWDNTKHVPHELSGQDILIVTGVNVPCDILPVSSGIEHQRVRIFDIRRQVGGQIFVDRVQVEYISISTQDAIENGWIVDNAQPVDGLVLVKANNLRTNKLISMQLWIPGSDWWIYEESPVRKSWRIR